MLQEATQLLPFTCDDVIPPDTHHKLSYNTYPHQIKAQGILVCLATLFINFVGMLGLCCAHASGPPSRPSLVLGYALLTLLTYAMTYFVAPSDAPPFKLHHFEP